jgi:hypothetical protein
MDHFPFPLIRLVPTLFLLAVTRIVSYDRLARFPPAG